MNLEQHNQPNYHHIHEEHHTQHNCVQHCHSAKRSKGLFCMHCSVLTAKSKVVKPFLRKATSLDTLHGFANMITLGVQQDNPRSPVWLCDIPFGALAETFKCYNFFHTYECDLFQQQSPAVNNIPS